MPTDLKSHTIAVSAPYPTEPRKEPISADAVASLIEAATQKAREAALREAEAVCHARKLVHWRSRDKWGSDDDKASCTSDALEAAMCAGDIRSLMKREASDADPR